MDIEEAELLYYLGKLTRDQIDEIATALLTEGCTSPSIIQLASGVVESADYARSFDKALSEMQRPRLSEDEAATRYITMIAAQIDSGEVDPDKGARAIASLQLSWYDEPGNWPRWFAEFYNIVDDKDGYFYSRPKEYVEAIMQAARAVLDA